MEIPYSLEQILFRGMPILIRDVANIMNSGIGQEFCLDHSLNLELSHRTGFECPST